MPTSCNVQHSGLKHIRIVPYCWIFLANGTVAGGKTQAPDRGRSVTRNLESFREGGFKGGGGGVGNPRVPNTPIILPKIP